MPKYSNPQQRKDFGNTSLEENNSSSHMSGIIQVINGTKDAVTKGVEFMNNVKNKMDLCYDSNAPSIVMEVDEYKNGYADIRARGGKIRVITEINKDNIHYCKELIKIIDELRHLDNIRGGVAISDNEYMTTTILHESKPLTQVVYSNVAEAVQQQQNFFDGLWERSIPAKQKIRDIINELDQDQIDIFSALDNNIRRSMLFYLNEKSMKVSQLAKKLNITLQAIQKHSTKLIEADLIKRNSEGLVSLTEIGSALIKQIQSIQFLFENKEYFKTHSLSYLPTKFVQRIGDLQESEIVSGVAKNIQKCQELLDEASEYTKFIDVPIYLEIHKEDFSKLFKKGMKVQYILGENSIVPRGWKKFTRKVAEKELISQGMVERRMIRDIHIMLYVSDKSAGLALPDLKGSADANNIIFSRDERFIDWCVDLFDYLWQRSRIFVEKKIQED